MESHGEVVRRLVSTPGVPWRAWCGSMSTLMEYHAEIVKVDTLMECHEEFVGYLHTREAVGNRHPRICGESVSANETDG